MTGHTDDDAGLHGCQRDRGGRPLDRSVTLTYAAAALSVLPWVLRGRALAFAFSMRIISWMLEGLNARSPVQLGHW